MQSGTTNLGRELCAFANSTGGIVLIGVTDDGKSVGVQGPNRLKSEIQSIARNPLLFGMLYRMDAVEHIGSGIKRIRQICDNYGVAVPEIKVEENWFTVSFSRLSAKATELVTPQVTTEVTTEVKSVIMVLKGEMTRRELQEKLVLKNNEHFRKAYLLPALDAGLIEMTIPDKPRSSKQEYRLTEKGRKVAEIGKG